MAWYDDIDLPAQQKKRCAKWWSRADRAKRDTRNGPDWRSAYQWLLECRKQELIDDFKSRFPFRDIPYDDFDSQARQYAEKISQQAIRTYNHSRAQAAVNAEKMAHFES